MPPAAQTDRATPQRTVFDEGQASWSTTMMWTLFLYTPRAHAWWTRHMQATPSDARLTRGGRRTDHAEPLPRLLSARCTHRHHSNLRIRRLSPFLLGCQC